MGKTCGDNDDRLFFECPAQLIKTGQLSFHRMHRCSLFTQNTAYYPSAMFVSALVMHTVGCAPYCFTRWRMFASMKLFVATRCVPSIEFGFGGTRVKRGPTSFSIGSARSYRNPMKDDNQSKERRVSLWLAAVIILLSAALGVALGLTFPLSKIV